MTLYGVVGVRYSNFCENGLRKGLVHFRLHCCSHLCRIASVFAHCLHLPQSIVAKALYLHAGLEAGAGAAMVFLPSHKVIVDVFGDLTTGNDVALQALTLFGWSLIIQAFIAAAVAAHTGSVPLQRCILGILRLGRWTHVGQCYVAIFFVGGASNKSLLCAMHLMCNH